MDTHKLADGRETFDVIVYSSQSGSKAVIFATGAGGLPGRYSTIINSLVQAGYKVIAPHFQQFVSQTPSDIDLSTRARRISLALDAFLEPNEPVAGVGHSIGGTLLLGLAGGQMWLGPGLRVDIPADNRLVGAALLAAPTGYFRAPGALSDVSVPVWACVGSEDKITPPLQTEWLAGALNNTQDISISIAEGAGHFAFMDQIPSNMEEPMENKNQFLAQCAAQICQFVYLCYEDIQFWK